MPRFRFTIRRLMVAVAIVGTITGALAERHARFRRLAAQHRARFHPGKELFDCEIGGWGTLIIGRGGRLWADGEGDITSLDWLSWHSDLAAKYEEAARRPWLPISPDPPEPNNDFPSQE